MYNSINDGNIRSSNVNTDPASLRCSLGAIFHGLTSVLNSESVEIVYGKNIGISFLLILLICTETFLLSPYPRLHNLNLSRKSIIYLFIPNLIWSYVIPSSFIQIFIEWLPTLNTYHPSICGISCHLFDCLKLTPECVNLIFIFNFANMPFNIHHIFSS